MSSNGHPRVVVTGLGVCAANGVGVEAFWDALIAGRSGISPISCFDPSPLRSRMAGQVAGLDTSAALSARLAKRTARFVQLGLVAAFEALAQAGVPEGPAREEAAVVVGTGIGGIDMLEREHETFLTRGPGRFHPLTVPMIIPNMAAAMIAMETGLRGMNLCVITACASGANSIGTAFDLIRSGRTSLAVAGGAESCLAPFTIDGYCQLRALSTRNDDPEAASRPFDRDRDGFVIAEGAGMVVLESLDHAQARGARPLAELVGYGATSDAHHLTAPDPEGRGAVRAMRAALADAGLPPEAVDLVNAHGTSTPAGDVAESQALHRVFGSGGRLPLVHATKSMIGHALGAASAIEAVVAALTLDRGIVHPTINLENRDPACGFDLVPGVARRVDVETVMSNAFGFGGHNAVLVLRRFTTEGRNGG